MYKPNKFTSFLKSTIFGIFKGNETSSSVINDETTSCAWSLNNENISVNKIKYEMLVQDNLEKTEIIEKLKKRSKEEGTLLLEYENTFSNIIEKNITQSNKGIKEGSQTFKKQREEIEKLRFSEERLKSHIKALKKESSVMKKEMDHQIEGKCDEIGRLKNSLQDITIKYDQLEKEFADLIFESKDNKMLLKQKAEELAEVIEMSKVLLRFV